jgi:hypothetical protein
MKKVINIASKSIIDDIVQSNSDFISPNRLFMFFGSFIDSYMDKIHTIKWNLSDDVYFVETLTPTYALANPVDSTTALTVNDDNGSNGADSDVICIISPAEEAINDVIDNIKTIDLPKGTENSLVLTLENAGDSLDKVNTNAAENKLKASVNKVESQRGMKITEEQADETVGETQAIIDSIQ